MSSNAMLSINGISKKFGGVRALNNVTFRVTSGKCVGLIGPNGSGKTTLINVISGLIAPDQGNILIGGDDVTRATACRRARMGINRTFQTPLPFYSLTVEDNVRLAAFYGGMREISIMEMNELLTSARLDGVRYRTAAELNSAQQKRLDIARALATKPKLLLVDEIAAGLNPKEEKELATWLNDLNRSGITFVVVEHLMTFLRLLVERVVVMDTGSVIFDGDIESGLREPHVREVFTGATRVS